MRFCEKCGTELADDAELCLGCGCKTGYVAQIDTVKPRRQINRKKIILIVSLAVLFVAVLISGIFIWKNIRTEQVKEQLAGKVFSYLDVGYYSSSLQYYEFDDEANCSYYYYYPSVMDEGTKYKKEYKIKFEKGMVFLEFTTDTLEVRYDKYGKIEGLYDIDLKKMFD